MKHIAVGGGKECPELLEKQACIVEGDSLQPCPRYCASCGVSIQVLVKPMLCDLGMLQQQQYP